MILEYIDGKLSINNIDDSLKPRHKSQLHHWSFVYSEDKSSLILEKHSDLILPKLINYFQKNNLKLELTTSCKNLLDRLLEKNNNYQNLLLTAKNFKDGKFDKKEFRDYLDFLNKNIQRKLKFHQVKASFHLSLIQNGANFSVPGSGKTTVVLSAYEKLRREGKVNTLFVVGPTACFGPWKDEFEKVLGKKPSHTILAGGNSSSRKSQYFRINPIRDLYLITFQTLLNDQEEVCTFLSNENIHAYLVIDEAHYIKQINGNWAKAVMRLAKHSNYRCILTGTPMPNSYKDLYNIFDFLWPENEPINSRAKIQLNIYEENKDYESASKILETSVGPLFYRVRKSELGLKPQIFHDPIIITMNNYERKIYDAIITNIKRFAQEDYLKNIDFIDKLRKGRMMRLRQCLSYTQLLDTSIAGYREEIIEKDSDLKYVIYKYNQLETPAKIQCLLDLVNKFHKVKEKVVIWSHFIGTIKRIEKMIKEAGFYSKKIIGETPIESRSVTEEETREKIIKEFIDKNSGLDILLANPAACAESISLHHTCHNAVYYDLSYNCAQYLQSLDRIHRVGGSELQSADYYFLMYDKTIDRDILKTLQDKAKRMYKVIENDYSIYSMNMFDDEDEITAYKKLFLNN